MLTMSVPRIYIRGYYGDGEDGKGESGGEEMEWRGKMDQEIDRNEK